MVTDFKTFFHKSDTGCGRFRRALSVSGPSESGHCFHRGPVATVHLFVRSFAGLFRPPAPRSSGGAAVVMERSGPAAFSPPRGSVPILSCPVRNGIETRTSNTDTPPIDRSIDRSTPLRILPGGGRLTVRFAGAVDDAGNDPRRHRGPSRCCCCSSSSRRRGL